MDRIADERTLHRLEMFWQEFAARYRHRAVIFAYDLRNEPEVLWDTPPLREKWNRWAQAKHGSIETLVGAWGVTNRALSFGSLSAPQSENASERELLDYQLFREDIAAEWTRRQVAAIKAADPQALVTVGLIQWSVPSLLPRVEHYSGFRPERQARLLDFLEIHFYPLDRGTYEYRNDEEEARNLAYLESVVSEAARPGKPVVAALQTKARAPTANVSSLSPNGGEGRGEGARNPSRRVRVERREIDDLFTNPGMGWQTFHRFADEAATGSQCSSRQCSAIESSSAQIVPQRTHARRSTEPWSSMYPSINSQLRSCVSHVCRGK